jgi:hypothetical protein
LGGAHYLLILRRTAEFLLVVLVARWPQFDRMRLRSSISIVSDAEGNPDICSGWNSDARDFQNVMPAMKLTGASSR